MANASCPLSDLSLCRSILAGIALLLVFSFCHPLILWLWLQVPVDCFFKYDSDGNRGRQPGCSRPGQNDLRDVLQVVTVPYISSCRRSLLF